MDRKISLGSFDGVEEAWEKTDEGKMILERIKAQQQTKKNLRGQCFPVAEWTASKEFEIFFYETLYDF